jgi:hypothetical protein
MKNKILLGTVFAMGIGLGAFAHRSLAKSRSCQSATINQSATITQWDETEEDTRCRMSGFQLRLDNLKITPTSDSAERLSQEMELQRGIDDILIKYREAQQVKFASFQTFEGAVLGAIVTLLTTWFAWRKPKSSGTFRTTQG